MARWPRGCVELRHASVSNLVLLRGHAARGDLGRRRPHRFIQLPVALLPRVYLEAALLVGYHFGGLDFQSNYRDRAGPTIAGELMLAVALSRNTSLVIGGGYRFAATGYSTGTLDHDESYAGHTMRAGGEVRF